MIVCAPSGEVSNRLMMCCNFLNSKEGEDGCIVNSDCH